MAKQKRTQDTPAPLPTPLTASESGDRSSVVEPVERAPQTVGDTTAAHHDRERIASRAYELYLARGGEHGRDQDDWLQAEREVSAPQDRNSRE